MYAGRTTEPADKGLRESCSMTGESWSNRRRHDQSGLKYAAAQMNLHLSPIAPATPAFRHHRQVFHRRQRENVQCVTRLIRRQRASDGSECAATDTFVTVDLSRWTSHVRHRQRRGRRENIRGGTLLNFLETLFYLFIYLFENFGEHIVQYKN